MDERDIQTLEIHQTALIALQAPTKRFRGRGFFSALKALKADPPNTRLVESINYDGCLKTLQTLQHAYFYQSTSEHLKDR